MKIITWLTTLVLWVVLTWCTTWWWKLAELNAVNTLDQVSKSQMMNQTSDLLNDINWENWKIDKANQELDSIVNEALNWKQEVFEKDFVWMNKEDVEKELNEKQIRFRYTKIDWKDQIVTLDLVNWRYNFEVENWKIISQFIEKLDFWNEDVE